MAFTGPRDSVNAMAQTFARRSTTIARALNNIKGIQCAYPKGAFYVFPRITDFGLNARDMQALLLEKYGLATVAGTSFGANGEGHIRLSTAASDQDLESAVDILRQASRDVLGA